MKKRTLDVIVASVGSALILAACANNSAVAPMAGPGGLTIQSINAPKVDLSFLSLFQAPQAAAVKLPARSIRGEDEATPVLATMIIAKAQAAQQTQAAEQISVKPSMRTAHACQGMDMGD